MNKILILGSQGYLGTMLGNYLSDMGHDCYGIDTGFFAQGLLYNKINFTNEKIDVRKIDEKIIKNFDTLILLAANEKH